MKKCSVLFHTIWKRMLSPMLSRKYFEFYSLTIFLNSFSTIFLYLHYRKLREEGFSNQKDNNATFFKINHSGKIPVLEYICSNHLRVDLLHYMICLMNNFFITIFFSLKNLMECPTKTQHNMQSRVYGFLKHTWWRFFAKIVNSLKPFTIFAKSAVMDIW